MSEKIRVHADAFLELEEQVTPLFNLVQPLFKAELRKGLKGTFEQSRIESVPKGFFVNAKCKYSDWLFDLTKWSTSTTPQGRYRHAPEPSSKGVPGEGTYYFIDDSVVYIHHGSVGGFAGGISISIKGVARWNFEEFRSLLSSEIESGLILFNKEAGDQNSDKKRGKNKVGEISKDSAFHPKNLKLSWTVKCDVNAAPSYLRHELQQEGTMSEVSDFVVEWSVHTLGAYNDEVMNFLAGADRRKFRFPSVFNSENDE